MTDTTVTTLSHAIERDDADFVEQAVAAKRSLLLAVVMVTLVTAQGKRKHCISPLHYSIDCGSLNVFSLLMRKRRGVDDTVVYDAMIRTIQRDRIEFLRFLFESKIIQKDWLESALHDAIRYGHFDIARLLLEHGASAQRYSALFLAISFGRLDFAYLFLEMGCNLLERGDSDSLMISQKERVGHILSFWSQAEISYLCQKNKSVSIACQLVAKKEFETIQSVWNVLCGDDDVRLVHRKTTPLPIAVLQVWTLRDAQVTMESIPRVKK